MKQKVSTVEVGWKKKFNDKTTLGVAYFHNDISNLLYTRKSGLGNITYTVNGTTYTKPIQRVENAGSATTDGIELELEHNSNKLIEITMFPVQAKVISEKVFEWKLTEISDGEFKTGPKIWNTYRKIKN